MSAAERQGVAPTAEAGDAPASRAPGVDTSTDVAGEDRPARSFDGAADDQLRRDLEIPELHLFQSVGSTLDVAHRLGDAGAPHGTVVIADRQTRGRGRGGKSWASPPGAGLWLTVLARPGAAIVPQVMTIRLGLAAARALEPLASGRIALKWPNDLFLGDRKLAGILVEARWRGARAEWLAVGIGVNVTAPGHAELGGALGPHVHRLDVLRSLMPPLRAAIDRLEPDLDDSERAEFEARDRCRGRTCVAPRAGIVRGLNPGGELLVETSDGMVAMGSGSLVLAEES